MNPHPLVDIFSYTNDELNQRSQPYRQFEPHFFGYLELLRDNGYIKRVSNCSWYWWTNILGYQRSGINHERSDLLDTMRSSPLRASIKTTARNKGIELTFDAIKTLSAVALTRRMG